ncbi:hypothetical protein SAMN05216480_11731 [Pustulibacterium marinum]|uniref:Uncharacterized protein n=1 Tax=Pustulibacterium marinum TaxID=1224947 RepID=A0A1I7IKE0_9FLAO|nr:hypothetical protein [Pustulibacterium marinum]SFU73382.1 hypothetical protein SAMN05216480_11731 [Pustulibacterium marinum]
MILDSFREKFIDKILNKKLNQPNNRFSYNKIQRIGCLVDLESLENIEALKNTVSILGLPKAEVRWLGYTKEPSTNEIDAIKTYSKKDINAFGKIKSDHVQEFINTEFDVLINYFSKDKFPLLVVSGSSNALMKAGFPEVDQRCNDIIINCEPKKTDVFLKELKTYLQVITK